MKVTKKAQKLRADAEARLAKARAAIADYHARKEAYPPKLITQHVQALMDLTDASR